MKPVLIALMLCASAHACKDTMQFTQDKQKHFTVSAAIGAVSRSMIDDNKTALAVALVPGIAKELHDMRGNGCASFKDMAYNAIGAAIGVASVNWIIRHDFIGYRKEF